ncbi:MAG: peptide deformylase [Phycisphaerae bacterium]|nr:peptide deformylase [Phycisphaerae bacterium]
MEIIKIHYKISKPVTDYKEIQEDAEEMKTLADFGPFKGSFDQVYAVAHCQVSEQPMAFFVVSSAHRLMFADRVIINPEIIKTYEEPVSCKEACLSFPYRSDKTVERYEMVRGKYQILRNGELKTVEVDIEGIASQVFQHEVDHLQGKNIYFKTEEPKQWW